MKNRQYLLDTNILIDFLDGVPSVVEHVLKVGTLQCCISVISMHELYYGAYLAKDRKEEYFEKELQKSREKSPARLEGPDPGPAQRIYV